MAEVEKMSNCQITCFFLAFGLSHAWSAPAAASTSETARVNDGPPVRVSLHAGWMHGGPLVTNYAQGSVVAHVDPLYLAAEVGGGFSPLVGTLAHARAGGSLRLPVGPTSDLRLQPMLGVSRCDPGLILLLFGERPSTTLSPAMGFHFTRGAKMPLSARATMALHPEPVGNALHPSLSTSFGVTF